MKFY